MGQNKEHLLYATASNLIIIFQKADLLSMFPKD